MDYANSEVQNKEERPEVIGIPFNRVHCYRLHCSAPQFQILFHSIKPDGINQDLNTSKLTFAFRIDLCIP